MLYQAEPDVPGATAEVNRLRKIIDARLPAAKVMAKVPAAPKELTEDQQRDALNTEGMDDLSSDDEEFFMKNEEGGYNGLFDMFVSN